MENQKRLEEYQNRQKEEENKKKLKKQREEDLRQKREKDAKERNNKYLKKNDTKKNKRKQISESESEESEEIKEDTNKNNKNNKKVFTFMENPFEKYKKDDDSDYEDTPIFRKKNKKKPSKAKVELPRKKQSIKAKFNDFFKFRQSDKISESEDSYSSEEDKKVNNKQDVKPEPSKSIETRRNKKNSLYNKLNDYFLNDINEENFKNKKSSNIKENKRVSQDKSIKKKGFYHYQNNPKKEEKNVVSKRFEMVTRNTAGGSNLKPNNYTIGNSRENIKRKNENNLKKKKMNKQNANDYININDTINYDNEKDLLDVRMKRGRNKNNQLYNRPNNSAVYSNDINMTRNPNNDKDINKSKLNNYKNNTRIMKNDREKNKVLINNFKNEKINNNIIQNLMKDFDQTMEEYSSIYNTQNTEANKEIKGNKQKLSYSKNKNNKSKIINNFKSKPISSKSKNKSSKIRTNNDSRVNIKENINDEQKPKNNLKGNSNNSLSHSVFVDNKNKNLNHNNYDKYLNDNYKFNNTEGRKAKKNTKYIKEKNTEIKNKKTSNKVKFNSGKPNHPNRNAIKIKKSRSNSIDELKEEELTLYRGQIDYNNVSIKNIDECIDDLLASYKERGYTLLKRKRAEFVFIKGPNTHYVEVMKLGNGLLYLSVTK